MIVRLVVLALALVAVTGCGQDEQGSVEAGESCKVVAADYRICGVPTGQRPTARSHIDGRDGDGWREVAGPPEPRGRWRSLHVSPDGRTLLATWSGECEVPTAYFLSAQGGQARPVADKIESVGLGWSHTGEARVELLAGACGHGAKKPGVYLIDPGSGSRKFVEGPLKGPMPLKSS
jgi:hypothetical protein